MTDITIKVNGIDCIACVERLERALSALAGVCRASASYSTGTAALSFDEGQCGISDIAECIERTGFAVPLTTLELRCDAGEPAADALRELDCVADIDAGENGITVRLWPLGTPPELIISALRERGITAQVSRISSGEELSEQGRCAFYLRRALFAAFLSLPFAWGLSAAAQLIFSAIVVVLCGGCFYKSSLRALRERMLSPDIIAALLLTVFFAVALCRMRGFVLCCMAVLILLLLRYAEAKSMCAIASRARRLALVQPKTARVINCESEVYITHLHPDDMVLVSAGERVPVDGTITDGECMLDASVLTGDKTPVMLTPGGEVFAGTLVRAGRITVRTMRFGEDTQLCRRIDALSHSKLPRTVQKLASALGITALLSVRNKEGSA